MASMVVIRCPETDEEVATGLVADLHHLDHLPGRESVLRGCSACGKDHPWSRTDAYLSIRFSSERNGTPRSMLRRR